MQEFQEEAVFRSTKSETGPDGSQCTTTTTTTTQKSRDGSSTVTKQTKQISRVGGPGSTGYTIKKTSADQTANEIANKLSNGCATSTSGIIKVKTEGWNSNEGVTRRAEKTQTFGGGAVAALGAGSKPNLSVPGGGGGVAVQRSPSAIKQMLLDWCKAMTKDYDNVDVKNFSSSWNDGMAFCALIHHFYPKAFDYSKLNPKNRRFNFTLAFDCAEKKGGIAPLLEVDDMVRMKNPDWKCVFTYIQMFYRRFRNAENNAQNSEETPSEGQSKEVAATS